MEQEGARFECRSRKWVNLTKKRELYSYTSKGKGAAQPLDAMHNAENELGMIQTHSCAACLLLYFTCVPVLSAL